MENVKIDEQKNDDHRRGGGVGVADNIDDPQDEEMKIEKFFSLIKSYREARNRLMMMRNKQVSYHDDHDHDELLMENEIKKKRMRPIATVEEQSGSRWIPSFECSDFVTNNNNKDQVVLLRPAPLMNLLNSCNIKQLEGTTTHHDHDQTPHNKASKQDNNIGLDLNLNLTL